MMEKVNFTLLEGLQWTPWQPLQNSWRDRDLPARPGLYRIRRVGFAELDYVGQTGRRLRERLGDLRKVYQDDMPYRAPHTVGPALWALLHQGGSTFEVSVAPVEGADPYRKAIEAAVIAYHRQQTGHSPTLNFGRMPAGYRMSSDNNQRLVDRGLRFRGGPYPQTDASHLPGSPPAGPLEASWHDRWCGFAWSPWQDLALAPATVPRTAKGLYLLRGQQSGELLYVGQGLLLNRLMAHARKRQQAGHPQGEVFNREGGLTFSWVSLPGSHDHQLLELENDLIAAFVLGSQAAPRAQFLGEGRVKLLGEQDSPDAIAVRQDVGSGL